MPPVPSGLPYLDQVASIMLVTSCSASEYCSLPSTSCNTCPCSIDGFYCAYSLVVNHHQPELLSRYPELGL